MHFDVPLATFIVCMPEEKKKDKPMTRTSYQVFIDLSVRPGKGTNLRWTIDNSAVDES